jgi:hypothetical protein
MAKSKAENIYIVTGLISFNRNCDKGAGECVYVPSVFMKLISTVHCSAVDLSHFCK